MSAIPAVQTRDEVVVALLACQVQIRLLEGFDLGAGTMHDVFPLLSEMDNHGRVVG